MHGVEKERIFSSKARGKIGNTAAEPFEHFNVISIVSPFAHQGKHCC